MSNPTDVTAPDTTPTDTTAADQTAAEATTTEGGEGDAPVDLLPVDTDAAALAAFDKGLEQSGTAPRTAADVAADAAAAAPAPAPAAAASAPAAAPAAAKAPEPDPETDKAVKELGLKGRAEERFRELTSQVKELTPLREALAKYQLTDPAKVEEVIQNAARAQEWEDTVLASTATPEQFGSALNVIKAMNSGDAKVMNIAFDALLQEVTTLGQKLGREVPGLIDPLEAHADLKAEVAEGDITRKRALEIASQRATAARQQEQTDQQQGAHQQQQAVSDAIAQVTALNDQLKASDPDFTRKLPLLQPALDVIRATMHPSAWKNAIAQAYAKLPALPPLVAAAPAPAPAAARPPVGHMPVRAGGINASMQAKPKNDLEAFELGLKRLRAE